MVRAENAFVQRKVLVPIARGRVRIGLKICVCSELIEVFGDFRVQSALSRHAHLKRGLICAIRRRELAIHLIDQREGFQIAGDQYGLLAGMRLVPNQRFSSQRSCFIVAVEFG